MAVLFFFSDEEVSNPICLSRSVCINLALTNFPHLAMIFFSRASRAFLLESRAIMRSGRNGYHIKTRENVRDLHS